MINLAIAADHRGYELKKNIISNATVGSHTINWLDLGTDSTQRTDYPLYALMAIESIRTGTTTGAVLLCGTGIGMCIVANRWRNIFAALVWTPEIAKRAKQDDNANILVLPADYVSAHECIALVDAWLSAEFLNGRAADRLRMFEQFGS